MRTEFKRIDTSVPLFLYIIGESIEGIVKDKQTTQIVQLGQEPSIRAFSLSSHFRLSSVSVFYWNLNHSLYLRPGVVLRMLYHSSFWCVLYVSSWIVVFYLSWTFLAPSPSTELPSNGEVFTMLKPLRSTCNPSTCCFKCGQEGSVSEILHSPTDYDLMLAFWSIWPGSPLDFCHSCHPGLSVSIMSTWREFSLRHHWTISVFL